MNRHFFPNMLIYLILIIIILSACASPQVQPTPIPSSPTPLPPTATPLSPTDTPPPTNTPIPPSATPTPPPPSPTPEPTFTKMEGKVDVGGRNIYYKCFGEGIPTIVLDSGAGEDSGQWQMVMPRIAPQTRICAYDRAGSGQSDPAPAPITSLDWATDIKNLLTGAGLTGPYILVGHSAGGLNVLVYATQYPQEVVGVILVDPRPPNFAQRLIKTLPYKYAGEPQAVTYCRGEAESFIRIGERLEWDFPTSDNMVDEISTLGDLPLIVITDTVDRFICKDEYGDLEKQVWKDIHAELAALSTNGIQVFTTSGHMVPTSNPDLVVETILQVLEQVRSE